MSGLCGKALTAIALLAASCGGRESSTPDLPVQLGGWTKIEQAALPGSLPDLIQQLGGRSAFEARYQGRLPLTVRVYETSAQAAAFELVQKWRPEAGTIAFHKGARFVVLEARGLDSAELNRLAGEVEKALP